MEILKDLRKIYVKLVKSEHTWEFLKRCKLNGILPKTFLYIRLPIRNKRVLENTKRICLKVAISDARRRVYKLRKEKAIITAKLNEAEIADKQQALNRLQTQVEVIGRKLKRKYVKKLIWLMKGQLNRNNKQSLCLEDVVTVIGDITIPEHAKKLLQKGPSYVLKDLTKIQDIIPKFELLIKDLEETEKERERWRYLEEYIGNAIPGIKAQTQPLRKKRD